jgi:two-component system, OmpR family, alkaline phosphatase synthesis response regulator PhoP
MKGRLLLVEDEEGLRMSLVDRLTSEGYSVEAAADGEEGARLGSTEPFDLILLDVLLPRKSGMDVCRELREQGVLAPILMLTARDQTRDKVLGLRLGADDYLTKPFEMAELLARIEAQMRRASMPRATNVFQTGSLRVDFARTEVLRDGRPVQLSAKELQLLQYFIEHRGETLSRERLLAEVWGYVSTPNTRTVDVHVSWLRQKLEADPKQPELIVTVHGLGYKFMR